MKKAWAYYNEFDPFAAAWLRELIKAGHIAPGEVDERSIEDVVPTDLMGFTQCHFFAGIGVWSYALRCAGWADDRPIWTGSCPCQPFSSAGKGEGFADERHLWPAFFHLISQCRPLTIAGEQVASKDGLAWLDLVAADLEGADYTCGAVDTCSAGFGAPHIRQRLYWVAHSNDFRLHGWRSGQTSHDEEQPQRPCDAGGLANSEYQGRNDRRDVEGRGNHHSNWWHTAPGSDGDIGRVCTDSGKDSAGAMRFGMPLPGCTGGLDNASSNGCRPRRNHNGEYDREQPCAALHAGGMEHPRGIGREWGEAATPGYYNDGKAPQRSESEYGLGITSTHRISEGYNPVHLRQLRRNSNTPLSGYTLPEMQETLHRDSGLLRPSPTNGFWRDADWLLCRDGKWRSVESGTFPLAHGAAARVGRLRGYGNALNKEQAQAFIEAVMPLLDMGGM